MPKRKSDKIKEILNTYSESRTIDLKIFSPSHTRLTDEYTVIDIWPGTGRYYVRTTSYYEQSDKPITERAGEKGFLIGGQEAIFSFLDKLFFATEMQAKS